MPLDRSGTVVLFEGGFSAAEVHVLGVIGLVVSEYLHVLLRLKPLRVASSECGNPREVRLRSAGLRERPGPIGAGLFRPGGQR